ncbi:MAG: hypothetical protein GX111_09745 [Clostridiales bacterium]|nr:hypothetical protein [Clostridiales bacterium]
MVKVIMGLKGSGKTKQLIELVTKAVAEESGDIVCLEKDPKLTYDIPYQARLIYANNYGFGTFEFMKGFISGIHAGNYDVTHIFIDGLYKMVGPASYEDTEAFLNWLNEFGKKENVKFTLTISADVNLATDGIRKYF